MALALPGSNVVQKISIIPRGVAALGYTLQLPTEDRFLMTQSELEYRIAVLLGGRISEDLIYGEVSTGAQDDLLKATDIAKNMVRAYGMSPKFGQVSFDRDNRSPFLQTGQAQTSADYSELTAHEIDCEIRRIIDVQVERVRLLLEERLDALRQAATVLLQQETMSGDELRDIVSQVEVATLEASVAEAMAS
jgi:cell division protease FtsH